MTRPRKRKTPRLPPPWVRRADWRFHADGAVQFCFPGLGYDAEGRELERLDTWIDANPDAMAAWMVTVDAYRGPEVVCSCPQCIAEMEGRA